MHIIKLYRDLHRIKKRSAIIACLFFIVLEIGKYLALFRGNPDLTWVYYSAKNISLFLFLILPFLSLINTILVVGELKNKWKKKTFWALISISPFLYFLIKILYLVLT